MIAFEKAFKKYRRPGTEVNARLRFVSFNKCFVVFCITLNRHLCYEFNVSD